MQLKNFWPDDSIQDGMASEQDEVSDVLKSPVGSVVDGEQRLPVGGVPGKA